MMDVEKELQEAKEDVNVGQLIGIIEHLQAESERRNELWGVATAKVAEARQEIEQLQAENKELKVALNEMLYEDDDSLTTCPRCGGVADNGYDRSLPPNPYLCTKCEKAREKGGE